MKSSFRFKQERRDNHRPPTSPTAGQVTRLMDAIDAADAADAKMPIEDWLGLSELKRIELWENFQDQRFAGSGSMGAYRREKRLAVEAGTLRREYSGMPSWLRREYAMEDPAGFALDFAKLIFHGTTATGALLQKTIEAMEFRTHRGWLGTGLTFTELKARVEEEVDWLGLREQFDAALAALASDFAERQIQ